MIRIVPFAPQHAAGVVSVILPIQQTELDIPITRDAQPDLTDIPAFYQRGNGNFWVAIDAGTVVGTVALLDVGAHRAALRKMFVARSYRGRRTASHGRCSGLCPPGVARIASTRPSSERRRHSWPLIASTRRTASANCPVNPCPRPFPSWPFDSTFYRLSLQGEEA
jgi:hypothetical protein